MPVTYTTSDPFVSPNGITYSHIEHAGVAAFTIPEDAEQRPGRDDNICWNWTEPFPGGRINMQAYGPDAKPGASIVRAVELREKKLADDKGGYRFMFLKLTETDAVADCQVAVLPGICLTKLEEDDVVKVVRFPQTKHDGGIVIAPLAYELPKPRPTSHRVTRNTAAA